ncbi:MAG: molybdopterin-dependent oxidoreductase, partial [Desulfohalobiaceae bacterium]|nr:molybdopterin-dependent oxidoreductase [Desulfohalobiaceae bacterium]
SVRSCLTWAENLDGANVLTIEGLGTPDNPHLIQEAFVLAGAIQCGFCTPGMILAAKNLLDANPKPTRDEIRHALRHNLCRCTGYAKIFEAVELAGRFLRGEVTPAALTPDPNAKQIGVSHPRPWAILKACGLAAFSADVVIPGALEIAVVRSPHHRANFLGIDTGKAENMPGVAGIMTAADIKGSNSMGLGQDQPMLCTDTLPVLGAPIAIVAADTREQALAAAAAVEVEYEVLSPMRNAKQALAEDAQEVHPGTPNLCHTAGQIKGDAESAMESAAAVVSGEFYSPLIHQSPLEPEAAVAYMDGQGEDAQLVVIGRSIQIHAHAQMIQDAVGWANVRYLEAFTGGQFGIKCDLTSEPYVAAAALHFQRPVRYVPSLTESMWMTPKRHPFRMKTSLGADADGRLSALEIDMIVENGAYMSLGPGIIERALGMLSSGYNIPNVKADAKLVYTNDGWGGAARGAGPPQANFALESCMDLLAKKLGMDPHDFRTLNGLQPGQTTSNGQEAEDWAFNACLQRIKPEYERAQKEARAFQSDSRRRGVGLAGSSFGIGEPADISHVAVELDPDGGVSLYASVADPGEGNDALLTQVCSHLMNIPREKVRIITRDTEETPDSGVSAGSRQTYMSGQALVKAIEALQEAMQESGAKTHDELVQAGKPTRYMGVNTLSHTGMDQHTGQGKLWDSYCHGVQLAEVEVDINSGEVRVVKMTAAIDPGVIINPLAVTCQIEGGMDMGAGMALREEYVHGETIDWKTYQFPSVKTAFEMETILLETPRKNGPLGATGIGEFTLVPTHPAIVNAIHDAVGARIYDMPATPDKVLKAIKAAG